jgi:hypothetical protein
MDKTRSVSEIISIVLRAVALAMGVAAVVLSILNVAGVETQVMLLGIGLFCLALDAMDKAS